MRSGMHGWVVVVMVLAAGCGKKSSTKDRAPTAPTTTAPAAGSAAPGAAVGEVEHGTVAELPAVKLARLQSYLMGTAKPDELATSGTYGVAGRFTAQFAIAAHDTRATVYATSARGGQVTTVPLATAYDPENTFAAIAGAQGGLVIIATADGSSQDPGDAEVVRLRWDEPSGAMVVDRTWKGAFLDMPAWASPAN